MFANVLTQYDMEPSATPECAHASVPKMQLLLQEGCTNEDLDGTASLEAAVIAADVVSSYQSLP